MIGYFVRHPNASNLLMLAMMALGLGIVGHMKRETLPELTPDKVQVSVVYKGATAGEVEDAICRRLEDALEGITDLEELRCEAREGLGLATAVMLESGDMQRFLDDVKSDVDGVDDWPAEAEAPIVTELGRVEDVVSVAVTGISDPTQLKAYAQDLKQRMLDLPDVRQVIISGFSDRQIRIELSASRLRQFGLSVSDVARALERQSVGTPAGRLQGIDEDVLLRLDARAKTVDAFGDLPLVSGATGAEVLLGRVATITDAFELDEAKVVFDGRRAALLDVRKTRGQDALDVIDSVNAFVDLERARVPPGIRLDITRDRASIVRDRLQMLVRNGGQGLVLVFLTLWLFFSVRYSFWVAMGLPVSFLGGLFVLYHTGYSINMISMVGLLIGIGLLMDDAIVVAENIAARHAAGADPAEAAVEGATEVLPGVLSSFATTVLVFGALAFIEGNLGQILRVLPVVLIVVLAVSLLEAFLILPAHLAHSMKRAGAGAKDRGPSRFRAAFERGFETVRDRWLRVGLEAAITYRYLTLGIVVMALLASLAVPASGRLGFRGFPDVEGDVIEARVLLPQGTPLARTEQVVDSLLEGLAAVNADFAPRQPEGQDLVRHVAVIHGENPDANETGPHVVRVSVDLLDAQTRAADLDAVRAAWREAVGQPADVISLSFTEQAIGPAGRPIDIQLRGEDLAELKHAAGELDRWLQGFAGVNNLSDDLRPGKREVRMRLKPGAGAVGLDAQAVSEQLRAAFQGKTIDEFPVGMETFEVTVRLAAPDRREPGQVENFELVGTDGALIPLQGVVDGDEARGWARIYRVDRERTVSVRGDVDTGISNAQALVSRTVAEFVPGLEERYPGVRVVIEGQSKESGQTSESIAGNALLGMLGVYVLLGFQFRSYAAPLLIMAVIPTAFVGVIWGHVVVGINLSMPSLVGMISLAGIVVNNSILLMQFIGIARRRGLSADAAALEAGLRRFRPIVLATMTTVAGLLPLLLEKSLQAQVLIPLATSLAFGLATATFASLFMVPALYRVLEDFRGAGVVPSDPSASASGVTQPR